MLMGQQPQANLRVDVGEVDGICIRKKWKSPRPVKTSESMGWEGGMLDAGWYKRYAP